MTGAVLRPTVMTVSRGRLAENVRLIKRYLHNGARMLAVIKADAYGHGIVEEARIAVKNGADALAVALVDEGMKLRYNGVKSPMLVLGAALGADAIEAAVANHITLSLFDPTSLELMQRYAEKYDTVAHAHLKIDTGMRRIGLLGEDELDNMLNRLKDFPRIKCEGIFTHFAAADTNPEFTSYQNEQFNKAVARVKQAGYKVLAHAAASSAIFADSKLWHDMVRPGVALYGAAVRDQMPELMCAQRLTTKAVRIETILPGDTVSYSQTFKADTSKIIATLPIGYGDGYPRALSNKSQVLIKGRRANVVGRVCMDMLMVDVTDIEGVSKDDEFVLMGEQENEIITPDELADKAGTIPYEIMLGFKERIPRVYVD